MTSNRCEKTPRVANGYPKLVVRLMAAVYTRSAVEFTTDPLRLGADLGNRVFRVLDPTPDAAEVLTPERRQAVLHAAQGVADAMKLRVSAVFSEGDAVYFAPGTTPQYSTTPPDGGLNLYDVKHVRKPAPDMD